MHLGSVWGAFGVLMGSPRRHAVPALVVPPPHEVQPVPPVLHRAGTGGVHLQLLEWWGGVRGGLWGGYMGSLGGIWGGYMGFWGGIGGVWRGEYGSWRGMGGIRGGFGGDMGRYGGG